MAKVLPRFPSGEFIGCRFPGCRSDRLEHRYFGRHREGQIACWDFTRVPLRAFIRYWRRGSGLAAEAGHPMVSVNDRLGSCRCDCAPGMWRHGLLAWVGTTDRVVLESKQCGDFLPFTWDFVISDAQTDWKWG